MYSGVTFLPMPSSISLSLLIVAQATVVSMFPVIVADAPDLYIFNQIKKISNSL